MLGGDELRAAGPQRDGDERTGAPQAGPLPHPAGQRRAAARYTQVKYFTSVQI